MGDKTLFTTQNEYKNTDRFIAIVNILNIIFYYLYSYFIMKFYSVNVFEIRFLWNLGFLPIMTLLPNVLSIIRNEPEMTNIALSFCFFFFLYVCMFFYVKFDKITTKIFFLYFIAFVMFIFNVICIILNNI